MSSSTRNHAKDRRLARRLSRKVTKTGERQDPAVYAAYLAGLQKGMELQEAQQIAPAELYFQDIFGAKIAMKPVCETDDADWWEAEPAADIVLH